MPEPQETWVRSLGWEDALEEEMATHSSILAWRIPQIEKPGGQQSMGLQRAELYWSDLAASQEEQNLPCGFGHNVLLVLHNIHVGIL